jgi:hypothetical protein
MEGPPALLTDRDELARTGLCFTLVTLSYQFWAAHKAGRSYIKYEHGHESHESESSIHILPTLIPIFRLTLYKRRNGFPLGFITLQVILPILSGIQCILFHSPPTVAKDVTGREGTNSRKEEHSASAISSALEATVSVFSLYTQKFNAH